MHSATLVLTTEEPTEEYLQELLWPFHDDGEHEESHWDYLRLGGRWLRSLLVKPGAPFLRGEVGYEWDPKYNGGLDPLLETWQDGVDAAPFDAIDWEEMRRRLPDAAPLTCWGVTDGQVWIEREASVVDGNYQEEPAERWQARVEEMIKRQPTGIWLAMVDFHD